MSHRHSPLTLQDQQVHAWLQQVRIAFVPGEENGPMAKQVIEGMLNEFRRLGHSVHDRPDNNTNILLTTAVYGKAIPWRKSLGLTCRVLYNMERTPTFFTLIHIHPDELEKILAHFEKALAKDPIDLKDFEFPGLAESAYHVLYEQGKRGGPILALERLLQAQAKSLNVLLLVGDELAEGIYHFDLVGAYPYSDARDPEAFYRDIVLRMVTRVSTHEVTDHTPTDDPVSEAVWKSLESPGAMVNAARELDKRRFFTEMVRIEDLVHVPVISDSVASQYSEGCFATWDTNIHALIATITGSARPVNKGEITDDDLAVITGVREDHQGTLIRYVEGKANYPPSSEAVEMIDMILSLPQIAQGSDGAAPGGVIPVVRSVLHGHRGISAFNPERVEFVPLDPPYYHYPVTCATEAQATGIRSAFIRSQALNNPEDPRHLAFTVLPTHGVVMAEKWVPGKMPFQLIWEYFDSGDLVLDSHVPQRLVEYVAADGKMALTGTG